MAQNGTRRAVAADRAMLTRLINAAFAVERVLKKSGGERLDAAGEEIAALMTRGTFLVAEDDGAAAGCVYLEPRGDECYLGLLAVAPERQGRGLGRRLADAAEAFARERACRRMALRIVSPRRDELVPFYAGLGYRETGRQDYPAELAAEMSGWFISMGKEI